MNYIIRPEPCELCGRLHAFPHEVCLACWITAVDMDPPVHALAIRQDIMPHYGGEQFRSFIDQLRVGSYSMDLSVLIQNSIKACEQLTGVIQSCYESGVSLQEQPVNKLWTPGTSRAADIRREAKRQLIDKIYTAFSFNCRYCRAEKAERLDALLPVHLIHAASFGMSHVEFWAGMHAVGLAAPVCIKCDTLKSSADKAGISVFRHWRCKRPGIRFEPLGFLPKKAPRAIHYQHGAENFRKTGLSPAEVGLGLGTLALGMMRTCHHARGEVRLEYIPSARMLIFNCPQCPIQGITLGFMRGMRKEPSARKRLLKQAGR